MAGTQSRLRRHGAVIVVAMVAALLATSSPASGAPPADETKLTPIDAVASHRFGHGVGVDGDTAIVGAPFDTHAGTWSGSAYVFDRTGASWSESQELMADDAAPGDLFGINVGLDGDTAVVGAQYDDDGGSDSGSAYVFVRDGGVWFQQQKLAADVPAAFAHFGRYAAVSGDTIVIGAADDPASGTAAGAAYVFERTGTTWTEQQKLAPSDPSVAMSFGTGVSIDGDTVVVGASDAASQTGAAYVFTRTGTVWDEQAKLTAVGGEPSDAFGYSTSVSGDTIVVGAPDLGSVGTDAGAAYVFTRSGTSWSPQADLNAVAAAAGDRAGFAVALDGNTVVVAAPQGHNLGTEPGVAYVFTRSGTTWSEQETLAPSDGAPGDAFGWDISLSGDTALVGALFDDTTAGGDAGSAYVFSPVGAPPNQSPVVAVTGDSIDEGQTATVAATFTDPDTADTHTATFDWGDGTAPEAVPVVQGVGSGEAAGSHVYGDNASFDVTVTINDGAGGSGTAVAVVSVANVAPAVVIGRSQEVAFPGGVAFVAQVDVPITYSAEGSDPGSDDLTFSASFGPTATFYNDGVGPDPFPSPEGTFPFVVAVEAPATFTVPGVETPSVELVDDDGGAASGQVDEVVVGDVTARTSAGRWSTLYRLLNAGRISDPALSEELLGFLEVVDLTSAVFSEHVAAESPVQALLVFRNTRTPRGRATGELLAAWLRFGSGSVAWDSTVPFRNTTVPFLTVMEFAESIVLDPDASPEELRYAESIARQTARAS